MTITLDQARALDAIARCGTFQRAGVALHKAHTAVIFALRSMEEQCGVPILDRRGYRTKITPEGDRLLSHCRDLLAAEAALEAACSEMKTGWEPRLRIVFDGIFPTDPILQVISTIAELRAPTRIEVSTEFLGRVEEAFVETNADVMISVIPAATPGLDSIKLAPIRAFLVAHKSHGLVRRGGDLTASDVADEILITVKGSDPRLSLSTAELKQRTTVVLNDFTAKKAAIMSGIGFGWMPEYLIARELARGDLARLPWKAGSAHAFEPRLYVRDRKRLGRAGQAVFAALREQVEKPARASARSKRASRSR